MLKPALISLFGLLALRRWLSRLSLSAPCGWTGASSELAQAGFHARYLADFHAGFNAPRSA